MNGPGLELGLGGGRGCPTVRRIVTSATAPAPAARGRAPLDPSVRALGFVSLLNDISSEVTIRTVPLFLANVLGVGTSTIGLIEGVAESASTLLKMISGNLADRLDKIRIELDPRRQGGAA